MYQYAMDRGDGLKGQIREHSRMNMRETSQSRQGGDIGKVVLSIEPPLALYRVLHTSYRAAVNLFSFLEGRSDSLVIRDKKGDGLGIVHVACMKKAPASLSP